MTRILYILRGLVPPGADPAADRFTFLSRIAEGDILLPVWWSSPTDVSEHLRPTFPVYRVGNFRYHHFLEYRYPVFLRRVARFFFYLRRGLQLHRENKFDVILTYGTNLPALAGVVLKWATGAKLIVEVPGVPENSFRYDDSATGPSILVKRFVAHVLLNFVGSFADCLRLFYPWQLQKYPRLRSKKVAVFHEFVPVGKITAEPREVKFVLSVGHPWYTKGIDVLIRAFLAIAPQFPDYKLKLLGYYPDQHVLEKMAGGSPQVEFLKARPNDRTLPIIASCAVFVLASRTDAAPRVLIEAMAAKRAIVASAIGGIPHYILDGENGLLFEPENVSELADKLAMLLENADLRSRLGDRGYAKVMSELDERSFTHSFELMLRSVTDKSLDDPLAVSSSPQDLSP